MPFSELIRFAKGKTSNLSSDVSFQGDSDCCELVWDKGPIVMRNQSSKDRKGASSNNLSTFVSKPQDKKDLKNSKAKFSSIDSILNDFPLSAPACDMGLNEDDNTVPWLNCPVVEPFNNVYSSDILPESFGVTGNEFAHSNSTANSFRLPQGSTLKSQHTMRRPGSSELSCSEAGDATGMKLQKNNTGQPNQASGLMNFSYFSRFASGFNTRNTTTNAGAAGNENKGSALSSHNHMESTFVNSSVGFSQQESGSHAQPSNGLVESMPPRLDSILAEQSVAVCRKPDGKSEKLPDKEFGSGPSKLVVDAEKNLDPAVASSSVGSGNSLERDSNNPASSLKRKCRETGDSEGPSEEVEDESVGVRKTGLNRSGSKRSRAAEVHNLSERRRRERINEKMRALQELIPNCNKVDKASMLDEAIEYLKTLQLQVQILSMGTGMYMSQMMLPAAMQHMHRAHMPQFSPMGIGMGAAMGFGMSMPDMNSMMQIPSIQGTCFPVSGPPISSPSGFYGAVSSSHQGLGHLGQGLSVSNPHAPHSLFGGIPMRFPTGNVSGMPGIADVLPNSSMNPGTNQENIGLNGQPHASNVDEAQNAIGLTPSTAAN